MKYHVAFQHFFCRRLQRSADIIYFLKLVLETKLSLPQDFRTTVKQIVACIFLLSTLHNAKQQIRITLSDRNVSKCKQTLVMADLVICNFLCSWVNIIVLKSSYPLSKIDFFCNPDPKKINLLQHLRVYRLLYCLANFFGLYKF